MRTVLLHLATLALLSGATAATAGAPPPAPAIGGSADESRIGGSADLWQPSEPTGAAYAGPSVIDTRAPGYITAMDRTARAATALERAIAELQAAQAAFPFPGFEYRRYLADLESARRALDPMLAGEQRRLRYQTLVPDGTYTRVPPALR